jgi:hypothetical protein
MPKAKKEQKKTRKAKKERRKAKKEGKGRRRRRPVIREDHSQFKSSFWKLLNDVVHSTPPTPAYEFRCLPSD